MKTKHTPIYFIEKYFIDEQGNLIPESNTLLDVLTDRDMICEATVNHMIRRDQKKEISRAAMAEEQAQTVKRRRSIRPTAPIMKAVK